MAPLNAFEQAMMLFRKKMYWEAAYAFGNVVALYPNFKKIDQAHFFIGESFLEMAMFDEGARSATARVEEDCELVRVGKDLFRAMLAQDSEIAASILDRIVAVFCKRLRAANELLANTVGWSLEVSGATALNLHKVIDESSVVEMDLTGGKTVSGRIIKVEKSEGGAEVTMKLADGRIAVVPYTSIQCIYVGGGQE